MAVQANAIVVIAIDGVSAGKWDAKTGGGTTATVTKHRPGGELREVILGSLSTEEPVTLNRVYDRARDHSYLTSLPGKVRSGGVVTGTWQPTDANMIPTSDPAIPFNGIISGYTPPDYDSTSEDKPMIEITVDVV